MTSLSDQGAYALASNYGGLIARMLFQPIEESSRNLFAKLCSDSEVLVTSDRRGRRISSEEESEMKAKRTQLNQASNILTKILQFYSLLSLFAITVGPRLSSPLLSLVAGRKWSGTGAADVLAVYCLYIPFLAINGVTEAFVAAVANSADLRTQSIFMTTFFGAFAGTAWICLAHLKLGGAGVVIANCVNMALRIVWNLWFINKFFKSRSVDFKIAFPNLLTCIASAVTMLAMTGWARAGKVDRFGFGVFGELIEFGGISGIGILLM